jgi:hypothetical protein
MLKLLLALQLKGRILAKRPAFWPNFMTLFFIIVAAVLLAPHIEKIFLLFFALFLKLIGFFLIIIGATANSIENKIKDHGGMVSLGVGIVAGIVVFILFVTS